MDSLDEEDELLTDDEDENDQILSFRKSGAAEDEDEQVEVSESHGNHRLLYTLAARIGLGSR